MSAHSQNLINLIASLSQIFVFSNTIRKYTAELERERALEKYTRFYAKHRETRAYRCFAYRIGDVEDIIDVKDITMPSDEIIYSLVLAPEYFSSYVSLHPERVIPLRVPP